MLAYEMLTFDFRPWFTNVACLSSEFAYLCVVVFIIRLADVSGNFHSGTRHQVHCFWTVKFLKEKAGKMFCP